MVAIRDMAKAAKEKVLAAFLEEKYIGDGTIPTIVLDNDLSSAFDAYRAYSELPIIENSFMRSVSDWLNENVIPTEVYMQNIQTHMQEIFNDIFSEMLDTSTVFVSADSVDVGRYARGIYKKIVASDETFFKEMDDQTFQTWLESYFQGSDFEQNLTDYIRVDTISLNGFNVIFQINYSPDYVNDLLIERMAESGNAERVIILIDQISAVIDEKYHDLGFVYEAIENNVSDEYFNDLVYEATVDFIETHRKDTNYRFTQPRREMIYEEIDRLQAYELDIHLADMDYYDVAIASLDLLSANEKNLFQMNVDEVRTIAEQRLTPNSVAGQYVGYAVENAIGFSTDVIITWDEQEFIDFCDINFE